MRLSRFEWILRILLVVVAVAWLGPIADALGRRSWQGINVGAHIAGSWLLYTTVGAICGIAVAAVIGIIRLIRSRLRPASRLVPFVAPAIFGICGVALVWKTSFWMFSGEGVKGSLLAQVGPYVVLLVTLLASSVTTYFVERSVLALRAKRVFWSILLVVGLSAAAAIFIVIDLTVYVSLYSKLHTALEIAAALCVSAVLTQIVVAADHRAPALVHRVALGVSAVAICGALPYVVIAKLRSWAEESLSHVWREPVYVGRMLSRLQIAESFLRNPKEWNDVTMSSIVRLRQRYDIATTARGPIWDVPPQEDEAVRQKLLEMRGDKAYNIIVYYVDTLRADVAFDPTIMPAVNKFAKSSIACRNAYSTGSDTLHALPGLVSGSYDLLDSHPNNLLSLARRSGIHTTLVAASSAHEFLAKLLPSFAFEDTIDIVDYAPGNEEVWGYGADQPTASRIVDRALDWLRDHPNERSLVWLFNFDVHNWRELDDAYVTAAAKKYGIADDRPLNFRYRVVARALDTEFQRLLDGIDDLGLRDDTIVLFVSDHGEGLGREGFWVHAVFLWEPLIRVPVILRIPGQKPAAIRERTSLVDVAPTLGRYMAPTVDLASYHGEDLLGYLLPGHSRRRLPLVLAGTLKEQLVRLGIIEATGPWKLILPLEGGVPELYDLRDPDPDARNVAADHPTEMLQLLNDLVRAPMFPRLAPTPEAASGNVEVTTGG